MTIPPDGPEQMPVIYVHGWRDDGADWGLASESCIPGTPKPRKVSGAQFFTAAGMPNWAVQWWSSDGSPTSSHEDGWAFLSTGDELIRGSTWMESGSYAAQNHPCPDPIEVNLAEGNFFPKLKTMRNTYNDAGSVEDQARDLLELIRYERTAGRLQDWSQINLLTHSKGSLVVRAMLDMAAKESAHDVDYIANVIYNAPPFGGSALAPLASIVFSDSPEDLLGSPWFHAMIDSWIEEEVDTVGGVLERINRTFTDIGRGSAELLQERLPPGTLAGIAALKLPFFKLSAGREIAAFQDNRTVREVLKTLQDIITPVFRHWMYFPGEPALSDLHPERMHLTAYTTQAGVNQYMTYGSPLKGTVPFPCDFLTGGTKLPCVGDIASSPLLLTNASQYRFSRGDLVVPVGSARILADTDAFGPPIQVLAEIPAWHGDLIYDVDRMGDHWMRIFLAPQSFLSLSGEIVEVSAKERSYLVTGETSFSPEARSATARTAPWYQGLASVTRRRTAEAKRFEYRLAPAFGGATEPTPWVSLPLGGSVRFSELSDRIAAVAGSPESPFLLQWRSINEDGGREMVRSARFVVEPEVAQVVSMSLIGQGNEVVSPPRGILRADRAVRSSVLARIGDPLVSLLSASSEPRWVLRNPDTKALSLVLSHRGSISYAWDDESMANPFVVTDVGGTLIPLTRLPEGLHVLTYQTFNPFGSSPRQSLRILVDETPPVVTFQYQSDHGFGHVVGPDTPLRFEVHDVGTGAGEGELRIEGYGGAPFPSNTTFRLGETSIGRGNEGVEGLMLTMVANVRDRVGNQKEERFEVYYDWVPPSIEVVEVKGALATGPGSYRAFQPEVEVVVIARDGASGVAPPVATTVVRDRGTLSSPAFVPEGRPNHWIGRVPLAAGRSQVSIATRDLMDNAEQVEISVEYSQIEFEQEPIETLSYRLDVECFASSGNPIGCTQGTISSLSTSVSGDAVAFSSAGNRFVRDDLNNVEDVFLWRAGSIIRVSEGPNGEEADRASNMPAISGNGRYVFFRSSATNLIEGTTGWNVFVKDTFTGALGLVSRRSDGTPANIGVADFQQISATYSGRYVVFESRGNDLVEGLTDENVLRDIFLVDLDPDGDGDFFNGAYVTHGISVAGSKTGNGFSHWPEISQNGKYIVFMTEATDLHPLLADYDGRLSKQAVLVELGGSEESGDLDPSRLSFIPISTSEATGGKMLAEGVSSVRIAPFSDTVVFAARGNVAETGDVNNPATGQDLYISSRTTPGGPIASRTIRWASQARGPGGPQTGLSNAPFASIAVAAEPSLGPGEVKVAWVSEQDNIEAGDANGVADLFLRRSSPTYPANLPVINWISDGLSSSEPVIFADLSPDGRYAIWATTQSYEPPYGRTEVSLYRRRIEPVLDTTLAVQVQGEGNVVRSPPGREGPTGHLYLDEDRVSLQAVAGQGYRFLGWEGADTTTGSHATVEMHRDREVRAVFVPMSPPVLREPLLITTLEDTPSTGIRPEFTDPDPDDAHSFSIVAQPSNGRALIVDGLVVYVPDLDFNGADAFTFQITDSAGLSLQDPGQAQVVVEPVNDPPLSATVEIRVRQDGTSAPTPPVVVDPDDGDSFEVRVLIEPEHGLLGAGEGRFVYTAGPSFDGADQFVFQAIDSGGESVVGFGTVVWGGDDEGEGGTGGGVGGSGGAGGTDDGDGSGGEGRDGGAAPGAGAEQDAGCGCGSGAGRGGGLVQGGLWTILFLGAWVRRMSRRVLPLD